MSAAFGDAIGSAITAGIKAGDFTALEVCEALLARIEAHNPQLNVFTRVTAARARAEATAVDEARAAGRPLGPLAGVPYAVKNLFDLNGEVTLAGARINAGNPPAAGDAAAVARMAAAGGVCLGAVNMGEYAYDFITANAHYGTTLNPHAAGHYAGGSSGGSGACIAAGLASLALGTDTNGSMRVPAAFCGVWGFKPTYGRVSRRGSFPFAGSLDTVGWFGRAATDLAATFDALAGGDPRDPVCAPRPAAASTAELDAGLEGLRCARLGGYFSATGLGAVEAACTAVAEALDARATVELPDTAAARAAAFVISAAEGGALHLPRLRQRAQDFDPAMRDRFLAGALTPASWYLHAQKFRRQWQRAVGEIFATVDVLIAPVAPMLAPTIGTTEFEFRGERLALRPNIGVFTQPLTLIGLPIVAAPVHRQGPLPTAVQLIAAPHREGVLLRAARHLERLGVCGAPVAKAYGASPP